jgi:Fuc2NAc and GlcNAc transferase
MSVPLLLALVFAGAGIGTGVLRRYALARQLMDVPNDRSSHSVPTPRGGGVSIVITFVLGVAFLADAGIIDTRTAIALDGAGSIVALIGFLDDHRSVAARWRLLAHFAAAVWALAWMGGLPPVPLFGAVVDLGVPGDAIAAFTLVWLLNLYNFMDGIDGIAGVEAITVCLGALLLYVNHPAAYPESIFPLLLAAATLGFLLWNYPKAKIFMGDAGSGFVGLTLGVLAIHGATIAPRFLWSWVILLGAFLVDATITLLWRIARRECLYQAHCSHAYQHAAQRVGRHVPVTLAVGAINLVWLLPLALLVGNGRVSPGVGMLLAFGPLVWIAVRLRAGRPAA